MKNNTTLLDNYSIPNINNIYYETSKSKIELDCKSKRMLITCKNCYFTFEVTPYCSDRLCVYCSEKRGMRLYRRYMPYVMAMKEPKLLTLTLRTKSELKVDTVIRLTKGFKKLLTKKVDYEYLTKKGKRKKKKKKKYDMILGGIWSIEIKKSNKKWNVHLHVLMESGFIDKKEIVDDWLSITGDSYIVDIERVSDLYYGLYYVLKYVIKPPYFRIEKDRQSYRNNMKGLRFVQTFGVFYNKGKKKFKKECPECKSNDWVAVDYMNIMTFDGWIQKYSDDI